MKRVVGSFLLAVAVVAGLVYWGSRSQKAEAPQLPTQSIPGVPPPETPSVSARSIISPLSPTFQPLALSGTPADYFPFTPGLRLEYRITVGPAEPLNFRTTEWSVGSGGIVQEGRGRFLSAMRDNAPKNYSLILQIVGAVTHEGLRYQWPGVEVKILKDDLGVFENVQELYWIKSQEDDFSILELRTYSPETPGAPMGPWGAFESEGGSSARVIFFPGTPGGARGLSSGGTRELSEEVAFLGAEGNRLHFVRMVKPGKRESSESEDEQGLNQAFEEHTWFEYGRGMVRLEQRVNGVVSMEWELVGSESSRIEEQ